MQPESDQTIFDWILRGRERTSGPRTPNWAGNFVSHLIPPVFEAYAKILHRVEAYYENIDNPLTPAEIAILKIPRCEPIKSFIENRRANSTGNRVRWRELAELLDVTFAPEICLEWYRKKLQDRVCWSRFLSGPVDGTLHEEECSELALTLGPFTEGKECFFRFSEWALINSQPRLFKGALNEVCGFLEDRRLGFEYWWPRDQSWCVCSDYDLHFTIVGGPKALTAGLLASNELECIEITAKTRIDVFAPAP